MGRKRRLVVDGVKNPLRRMFGVYVRLLRNRLGISAEDLAENLSITATYFRLIESGSVPLSHGKALCLIEMFRVKNIHIHFTSLAIFLVGMDVMDFEMVSKKDGVYRPNPLGDIPDFREFCRQTATFSDFKEGSARQKQFLETVAFDAVRIFLESSPAEREHMRPNLQLDGVSAGGVEVLKVLMRKLQGQRFINEPP